VMVWGDHNKHIFNQINGGKEILPTPSKGLQIIS
jgi:hypothetical protein